VETVDRAPRPLIEPPELFAVVERLGGGVAAERRKTIVPGKQAEGERSPGLCEPAIPVKRAPLLRRATESTRGKWIAWESDESGRAEVYVRSSAGEPGRWQISTDGGGNPRWVRGNEIIFQNGSKLMSVAVETRPLFNAAPAQLLFERAIANYDVAADGRIVIQEAPNAAGPGQLNVVLNWFEEVRSRSEAARSRP
jgi:hypothetical protein